jgi:hypothetical protein
MENNNNDWGKFREAFSIPPTTEDEYREKRLEVIDKFSKEIIEKNIQYDPLTVKIIECLIRNENPYTIIEQLIQITQQQQKQMQELISFMPPQPILKQ